MYSHPLQARALERVCERCDRAKRSEKTSKKFSEVKQKLKDLRETLQKVKG
jgi:transcription initiation factor IIE alpha subunit